MKQRAKAARLRFRLDLRIDEATACWLLDQAGENGDSVGKVVRTILKERRLGRRGGKR